MPAVVFLLASRTAIDPIRISVLYRLSLSDFQLTFFDGGQVNSLELTKRPYSSFAILLMSNHIPERMGFVKQPAPDRRTHL